MVGTDKLQTTGESNAKLKHFTTRRMAITTRLLYHAAERYEENFHRLRQLVIHASMTETAQNKTVDLTGNADSPAVPAEQPSDSANKGSGSEQQCLEILRGGRELPAQGVPLSDVYTLLHKIGEGGNGRIYLARDNNLDILCAIKILSADRFRQRDARSKFYSEIKTTAKLRHPNIVNIFYANQIGDFFYYVMEYIQGKSCEEIVNARKMSEAEVIRIAIPLAEALKYAHQHNVIHRDIKPANIMLDENGVVKLLDLGLAISKHIYPQEKHDEGKQVVGTPHYLSPEQARGDILAIDERTDIYAFGATLYHLLTGHVPFQGRNVYETLGMVLNPQLLCARAQTIQRELSDGMDELLARCLAKDRTQRPADMQEILTALQKITLS